MHRVNPVTLDNSILVVREGREGLSVMFSPRALYGVDVAQSWRVPNSIPELCLGAERG